MEASSKRIKFGDKILDPSGIRVLEEMKEVVYDRAWLKEVDRKMELYYIYRALAINSEEREKLERANLSYDITVIPPKMLGCEYVKTLGHYHPDLPSTAMSYPEIYEVLGGRGHYLLQNFVGDEVEDVILIEAKRGDLLVIPPNYGHITINPSQKEELKMANLVARNFSSLYGPIKEKRGGAYFELNRGWVKNENYSNVPEIRVLKPTRGIFKENIYQSFMEEPSKFEFLTKPQEFEGLFEEINLL